MPALTLADALRMPAFRQGAPAVIAGSAHLRRPIRWIHVTELTDIAPLLRPGDLVLTTGTGLPRDDDETGLADFARSLADAESTGLVIELGRRWRDELPVALREACEDVGLPLVALTHETRFAAITQAVGEQIIDRQLADLREAQRVHDTFTELSFTQAGPADILQAVQRLADGPVVLESADHRPLDFLAGRADTGDFLDNWQARSARVRIAGRTGWDERLGWLVTRLGTREQAWGRLVIAAPAAPTERMIAVAERAAAALALHRLHDRDRDNLVRRTHHELMLGLRSQPDDEELLQRCELARFPTRRRRFVGLVVRRREVDRPGPGLDELIAATVAAAHVVRTPALVCEVDRDIRVLVSTAASADAATLVDRLGQRLRSQHDVIVASGQVVDGRDEIDRTLREAHQVADAVGSTAHDGGPVHRLGDLHLRGLLALLADDDRVRLFIERELAPLRRAQAYDDLVAALRALLSHPTSKTDAAASLHLSRAAFYDRVAKIERILGADLDDPDVRVSLHVALLTEELLATE